MPWKRDGQRMEKFHYKENKQTRFPTRNHDCSQDIFPQATGHPLVPRETLSLLTHTPLPSSHKDFSVLMSTQHWGMEVKTGTLSLFTSRTVVTCNNQKIDSYTQSNLSNNSQGSVKLGWPYTGRGTAYNTQAGKCSYLPHFQIIKPQHKGLTPQGDQCDFLHPHKAQRVFWSGCF